MTINNLIVLLSQFWTSQLFHVRFCCFLTCIQVSQETGKMIWYSHLFKDFPQFLVIHTVKGFRLVNEAELDIFLELPCFPNDPMNVDNSVSSFSLLFLLFSHSVVSLCDSMDCSTPGFPVLHHLPELAQTHVHWVSDAIQPSHPLLSPSSVFPNIRVFSSVTSSHQVVKVLEHQLQHQSFQWIFRVDFL